MTRKFQNFSLSLIISLFNPQPSNHKTSSCGGGRGHTHLLRKVWKLSSSQGRMPRTICSSTRVLLKRLNVLYYHGNCGKHTFPNKYYFFSMVWSNEKHMFKSAMCAVVQAAANRKYRKWTPLYKGFLLQKYNVKTRCRQKTLITDGKAITGIQNTFLINLNHMLNVFIF